MTEENKKMSKAERLLKLYNHLQGGKRYTKAELATEMDIDERTVQRDIRILNTYLEDIDPHSGVYIRNNPIDYHYEMIGRQEENLNSGEILVLAKILLESRALEKEELDHIIQKLVRYSKRQGQESIEQYILSEKYHYTELQNNSKRIEPLVNLAQAISGRRKVKLEYIKQNEEIVERLVKPISIMFSEYYFYLIAYLKDETKPIMYRIDRILAYEILEEGFSLSEQNRFEEGEIRKRIQFMYPGELMTIKLRFWGPSLEALLDRLPTAKIVEKEGEAYIIQAEVYGKGVKMWLLSQANYIEVLEPLNFREEMKQTIEQMFKLYN
ncbi:helix-turn-helix transcriptional regulator [Cellulosilyticum lentocellum]|uniref:WYL domain-containing protein n=1 Tax=Cellulosilyticum lentocellum (strain ATCC 49066 / DSM 5427 / NCIMB 11756 / RHM5) TaxID=642492 RepID=F2JI12_CELLD|nr:WYL domain-containing protein [Cellulosilyticum lentocellum]ADZ81956.1 hypothetical protein Clole_0203 [Cellulosilyticum lentocellum DSM 5427]